MTTKLYPKEVVIKNGYFDILYMLDTEGHGDAPLTIDDVVVASYKPYPTI